MWKRPGVWSPMVSESELPAPERKVSGAERRGKAEATETTLMPPIFKLKPEGGQVPAAHIHSSQSGSVTHPVLVAEPEGEGGLNASLDVPIDSLGRVRTQEDLEE